MIEVYLAERTLCQHRVDPPTSTPLRDAPFNLSKQLLAMRISRVDERKYKCESKRNGRHRNHGTEKIGEPNTERMIPREERLIDEFPDGRFLVHVAAFLNRLLEFLGLHRRLGCQNNSERSDGIIPGT